MIAPEGYSYRLVVGKGNLERCYIAARPQLEPGGLEAAGFERLTRREAELKEPMVSLSIFHYTAPRHSQPEAHYHLQDADWERTCAAIESVGFVLSAEHGP